MSLATLMRQTVTIEHVAEGTTRDRYNNVVSAVTSTSTSEAYLEQTDAQEVTIDRETYTTDWLLLLPASVSIDAGDRVIYGGLTLEVVGPPGPVFNPRRGVVDHIEARLRAVTG